MYVAKPKGLIGCCAFVFAYAKNSFSKYAAHLSFGFSIRSDTNQGLKPLVIIITCACNEYPLTPHFYIVKLGFTGVYIIFLFLLQNIDRGCSLAPPD